MAENSTVAIVVGQVVIGVGMLFQLYRESRNRKWDLEEEARKRKWDLEDRQAARLDMDRKRSEATETAAKDRHEIADHVTKKIEENTAITNKALEVASQVQAATKTTHERIEDILKSFDSINGSSKVELPAAVVIKAENVIVEHPGKVTT